MRLVVVDEAGISAEEPVTVVVAMVIEADQQASNANLAIEECLRGIPQQLRQSSKFSTKQIFSGSGDNSIWSPEDRLRVLFSLLQIPAKLGITIVVAAHWKGRTHVFDQKLTDAQNDHLHCFGQVLWMADRAIRRACSPLEKGFLIVEKCPKVQGHMSKMVKKLGAISRILPPDLIRRTPSDAKFLSQSGDLRMERIMNCITFTEKDDINLTYLSDAASFAIRRYLCRLPMGKELASALVVDPSRLDTFQAPGGSEIYYTAPPGQPLFLSESMIAAVAPGAGAA